MRRWLRPVNSFSGTLMKLAIVTKVQLSFRIIRSESLHAVRNRIHRLLIIRLRSVIWLQLWARHHAADHTADHATNNPTSKSTTMMMPAATAPLRVSLRSDQTQCNCQNIFHHHANTNIWNSGALTSSLLATPKAIASATIPSILRVLFCLLSLRLFCGSVTTTAASAHIVNTG